MLIDMLAAIARRDYEQRRERQKQGITKAKEGGLYRGRKPNHGRYDAINKLLANNHSWSEIQNLLGCSRGTISAAIKFKTEKLGKMKSLPQNS
jgi:DNA invertase Pin-like site-specific DNA recombinase